MVRTIDGARQWLLDIPVTLRARLGRSPRARAFVYRLRNAYIFSDLAQHDRMLHDEVRVEAYHRAIQAHVAPGDVVVDVGTGTGILSAFAARRGARVHAVEHGPIIETAKAVVADNGITGITFHRTHSGSFDPGEPVDTILHEQIGDALFDEQVVANIADLRDRILRPGGRILPAKLDLYIEPIQLRSDRRVPFAWENRLHGVDFRRLRDLEPKQTYSYRYGSMRAEDLGQLLCAPEPVVRVDLMTARPDDLPRRITYERPVVADGSHDGYAAYFIVAFDEENTFSNRPDGPQTSWGIPFLRVQSRPVRAGEAIRLDLVAGHLADPNSWSW